MQKSKCKMMNQEKDFFLILHFALCIYHFFFILFILSIPVNFFPRALSMQIQVD